MKTITPFLFALIFFSVTYAQVQVSNVYENDSLDYLNSFFADHDDHSYLISRKAKETQIVEIEQGELKIVHTINERPFSNSMRGISISNDHLVHSFNSGFLISSLSSGITSDTIFFEGYYTYGSTIELEMKDYIIHIVRDEQLERSFHLYNILTGEITIFDVSKYQYYFNKDAVFLSESDSIYYSFNLETMSLDLLAQFDAPTLRSGPSNDDFFVVDQEGLIHIYDDNSEILTLKCNDAPETIQHVSVIDGKLFVSTAFGTSPYTTLIYDITNCELLTTLNGYYFVQTSDKLPTNFVLLQQYGGYTGSGLFNFINTETLEVFPFEIQTDVLDLGSANLVGDVLYITGVDDLHYWYAFQCFTYDFSSMTGSELKIGVGEDYEVHQMSTSTVDNVINFQCKNDRGINSIWQLNLTNNEQILLNTELLEYNIGLYRQSGGTVAFDSKDLLTMFNRKMYHTLDDETGEILDNTYSYKLLDIEGTGHILVERRDSLFAAIIDQNQNIEYHFLTTDYFKGAFWRHSTSNAIFLPDNIHYNGSTISLDSIPYESNENIEKVVETSGDKVFCYQYKNSNRDYYTYNTKTRELKYLDFLEEKYPDVYDIGDSRFLFVEDGNGVENQGEVFILNANSEVINKESISYTHTYYGDYYFANKDFVFIALPAEDLTRIYMSKGGESRVKSVENEGTLYYRYFEIANDGDDIVLEVSRNDIVQFAHLSWNSEASYFGEVLPDEMVEKIFINSDNIVVILSNQGKGELILNQYDKSSKEKIKSRTISSPQEYADLRDILVRLNDNVVLLSLDDGVHGYEMYRLNIKTLECSLVSDLYQGSLGSNPEYVTMVGDDVYFTANAADFSRQLFRYDITGEISKITNVGANEKGFLVSPNPTSHTIRPEELLTAYTIYNMSGKIVMERENNSLSELDVSSLIQGLYVIVGQTKKGDNIQSTFVKN